MWCWSCPVSAKHFFSVLPSVEREIRESPEIKRPLLRGLYFEVMISSLVTAASSKCFLRCTWYCLSLLTKVSDVCLLGRVCRGRSVSVSGKRPVSFWGFKGAGCVWVGDHEPRLVAAACKWRRLGGHRHCDCWQISKGGPLWFSQQIRVERMLKLFYSSFP